MRVHGLGWFVESSILEQQPILNTQPFPPFFIFDFGASFLTKPVL